MTSPTKCLAFSITGTSSLQGSAGTARLPASLGSTDPGGAAATRTLSTTNARFVTRSAAMGIISKEHATEMEIPTAKPASTAKDVDPTSTYPGCAQERPKWTLPSAPHARGSAHQDTTSEAIATS